MASPLILNPAYEAENPIESSLRNAFQFLQPQLRPPFPLTIPTQSEYFNLNRAILYGLLCEPDMAKVHIKHLHGIVTDGYSFFTTKLIEVVNELYPKLVDSVKGPLIWVTSEMVYVSAEGIEGLLVSLLRQIVGGDLSEDNLWLCSELISLFSTKWDVLLEEAPLVLTSALYSFLRLLADHYRVSGSSKMEVLKRMEIDFCVRGLREHFHLCLRIGRDLVRLLQDLVHIPEFRAIWRDLLLNPVEFKTPGFVDILQLYRTRTSSRYFLLRVTPEMETQLRFLLTHVKWGNQYRYQDWFSRKFLCMSGRETLVIDIVRFICCGHHPPNEVIQSKVIQRWAVVGWLLTSCTKNYVEANAKLALFYDWLFFHENVDNIMNIEPAILLMINSIPKYVDVTHTLLEFLFLLVDNYDVQRKENVVQGVSSAFDILARKGVVQSLKVLTRCNMLSTYLKERLEKLVSKANSPLAVTTDVHENALQNLFRNLRETIRSSIVMGVQTLDKIMLSFVNQRVGTDFPFGPEALSCKIAKEFELSGYKLFDQSCDEDDIQSPTALIIRYFIFSQHKKMHDMLLFWSRNGFSVGPCLLSYTSRLAHEVTESTAMSSLLKFHVEKYSSFTKNNAIDSSYCNIDKELVTKLVNDAFAAYRCYLIHTKKNLHEGSDISLAKLLFSDLMSHVEQNRSKKFLKILLCSIFSYLPDLSIGEEDIMRVLVCHLDHDDLLGMQFQIGLKKLSIFGENTEAIFNLIKSSFDWGCVEQYKLWSLIRSELAVSEEVQIEKLVLETFCTDQNVNSIAISGLLSLCSCRGPTPELVGAIMLLPNDKSLYFATAVLATWAFSNQSLLFSSLSEFLEKLKNRGSLDSDLGGNGILINDSAFSWLLSFLDAQGIEGTNVLSNFYVNIPEIKSMIPSYDES